MNPEKITLFYRQEKSDKVYKASLEEQDGNFIVNFAYGRRGATLRTGTKTQSPVPYEKAKIIYDKLVLSKSSKGYIPDEDDSEYVYQNDQKKTGIHCQLLNPIDKDEVDKLIADSNWWMQEKKDGKRLLIKKDEETIAINRKGLSVGAPEQIITSVNQINTSFIIDGEAIDNTFFVFDLLFFDGTDIKEKTYKERYELLCNIKFHENIEVVKIAQSSAEKQNLFDQLKEKDAEGIVLKKHESKYQAGRPNSGGNQVKYKFYDTASVIVTKVNDKRSVGVSLFENDKEIFVGNVTISVNKEVPQKGEIIEVRYLYAYKNGSLYQPTFLHIRTDIDAKDCVLSQLKYKPE